MTDDLEIQIAKEAAEIENSPKIPLAKFQPKTSGMSGRCHWCGRVSGDLVLVDVFHGVERYKGECCGQRHR